MENSKLLLLFKRKKAWQKLVTLFGASSIVEIWPLNETSGTVARGVVNGYNGTYTGVDLANVASRVPGNFSPYFDGANDYVNVYSAGLAGAFNTEESTFGSVGNLDSALWTDGLSHTLLSFGVDASNYQRVSKSSVNNQLSLSYSKGGTSNARLATVTPGVLGIYGTISTSNNRMRLYVEGLQSGADLTISGTWTGALNNTRCVIGAAVTTPANPFKGYLSYAFLLNREGTAAEMLQANKILGGA